jgi:hypothetical protein
LDFAAIDKYPADVVAILPSIANLKSDTRKALQKILKNPGELEKKLGIDNAPALDDKTVEKTP